MEPQTGSPPHIDEDWPLERLDQTLKEFYGYSLFDFALSLAIILRRNPPFALFNIWRLKQGSFAILEDYQAKVESLERAKDLFARRLSAHLEDVGYWRSLIDGVENPLFPSMFPIDHAQVPLNGEFSDEEKARVTKGLYGLDRFEKIIDAELSHYESLIRLYSIGGPGRPALVKTIISSLWSYVLRFQGRLNTDAMVELLNWFVVRLSITEYGSTLERSLAESYPTSEDMSRFKRHFKNELLADLRQIFHNNYLETPNIQVPRVLGIRFDLDEPKFFRIQSSEDMTLLPLIFPQQAAQS